MKNIIEKKVYYSDTDAYGVVWHGSYLRWMEMGRVEWCEQYGQNLVELKSNDIVLPVVGINIRYKASARLNDCMVIETNLSKFSSVSATFHQQIKSKKTGKLFIDAYVDIVAIDNNGKLYRKIPKILADVFEEAMEKKV